MIKIADVAMQIRGVSYKPEDVLNGPSNDAIGILRANNIVDGDFNLDDLVYVKANRVSPQQMLRKGDILICASSGSKNLVGKATKIDKDYHYSFGAFCKVVRPYSILPEYLSAFFQSKKYRSAISALSMGANINNIRNEHIDEMLLPSVSDGEQKSIAKRIFCVSQIIASRKEQLAALDTLIKSRFVEMFGDRYTNNKKWTRQKLGECLDFHNGKAHEQVVDENGEFVLVTSRAIASDFSDVRRTNALLFPLHINDIVMVMSDIPNGRALAKCMLINADKKYTLNQRICSFDEYDYNPVFLCQLLKRHPYFLGFNNGNSQTNLRKEDVLNCMLINPPLALQNQFATFVAQVDKSKVVVQQALDEAQVLFDSLMQKYFG